MKMKKWITESRQRRHKAEAYHQTSSSFLGRGEKGRASGARGQPWWAEQPAAQVEGEQSRAAGGGSHGTRRRHEQSRAVVAPGGGWGRGDQGCCLIGSRSTRGGRFYCNPNGLWAWACFPWIAAHKQRAESSSRLIAWLIMIRQCLIGRPDDQVSKSSRYC
jgi:hypothetical protein